MGDMLRDGGTVLLFRERALTNARAGENALEELERHFARFPGPLRFIACHRTASFDGDETISWETLATARMKLLPRQTDPDPAHMVLLTVRRVSALEWMSGVNPLDLRQLFVRAVDWGWVSPAPLAANLAVEILQNLLESLLRLRGYSAEELLHERPRGCINDQCDDLRDFTLKLRTADICVECLGRLEASGASEALLRQVVAIHEDARLSALSTSRFRDVPATYERWPFPVAVTRHKATLASGPFHRFHLYLDHFDSLVRYLAIAGAARVGRTIQPAGPSLGWWVDELGQISDSASRAAHRIATRLELVKRRNDTRGHGYAPADEETFAPLADETEEVLAEIEQAAAPILAGSELVYISSVEFDDGIIVRGERLQGSNALFCSFEEKVGGGDPKSSGLHGRGRVALHVPGSDRPFIDLDRMIVRAQCGECRHLRVLVVDSLLPAPIYLDPMVGHRTRIASF